MLISYVKIDIRDPAVSYNMDFPALLEPTPQDDFNITKPDPRYFDLKINNHINF